MAIQAAIVDNLFDKLCFINEIGTQMPPQLGEGRRKHNLQNTPVEIELIHREENQNFRSELVKGEPERTRNVGV